MIDIMIFCYTLIIKFWPKNQDQINFDSLGKQWYVVILETEYQVLVRKLRDCTFSLIYAV